MCLESVTRIYPPCFSICFFMNGILELISLCQNELVPYPSFINVRRIDLGIDCAIYIIRVFD
jgi:hypothetical protein